MGASFGDIYHSAGKFSEKPWSNLTNELHLIAENIFIPSVTSLLDVGCGTAFWSTKFIKESLSKGTPIHSINLVDFSEEMLSIASKNILETDRTCHVIKNLVDFSICGQISSQEFYRAHIFDLAIMGFFLSHYNNSAILSMLKCGCFMSKKILIIDSIRSEHNSHYPVGLAFKEHFVNGEWISVPKRYEYLNFWQDICRELGVSFHVLTITDNFFSAIIE